MSSKYTHKKLGYCIEKRPVVSFVNLDFSNL